MEEYLTFAKELAKEAEEIALKYFGFDTETTWKGDNTPLTQADTEINDLVIQRVNERYPEHSIYGEEKSDRKEGAEYIWVCDPIDGTMAFSCGMSEFVFSIALVNVSNGLPVFGLIHNPIMKNTYWAHKDGGAYRDGKKIIVLKKEDFANTYLSTGASGRALGFSNLPLLKTLSEKKCATMKFPGFIYGAIQVANGKYIGAVYYHKYAHDVAALKIITEEAGGKVTDLNGEERRYDEDGLGCIISNGILHDELVQIVQTGKV
ncbi:MAG: inositol monophosphatase [Candidatus Yonathbacteria bacterium]|nr:inositol monophosphatase [Candidatus Yonathbacteria bacterium]NTW47422.1 inositol monophosphatase [Candidatus Yonathbacteria bacterium]